MAAAALVVAAIVVGAPADAAVTADAAPRDRRPGQEGADLAAWRAHLGGDCGAAGRLCCSAAPLLGCCSAALLLDCSTARLLDSSTARLFDLNC